MNKQEFFCDEHYTFIRQAGQLIIDPVNNSVYLPFIKCDRLGGHQTQ